MFVGIFSLYLVKPVEKEDDQPFFDGLRQPERQRLAEFIGIGRNIFCDIEAFFEFTEQPAQEAIRGGTVRCGTKVVLKEELFRMRFRPVPRPCGEQGGLAAATLSGNDEALAIVFSCFGKGVESPQVGGAVDAGEELVFCMGLVGQPSRSSASGTAASG